MVLKYCTHGHPEEPRSSRQTSGQRHVAELAGRREQRLDLVRLAGHLPAAARWATVRTVHDVIRRPEIGGWDYER